MEQLALLMFWQKVDCMASPKIKSTKNFILKDIRLGNIIQIILYFYYINFIFKKYIFF